MIISAVTKHAVRKFVNVQICHRALLTVECIEQHTAGESGVQWSAACTLLNDIIHSRLLWESLVLDLDRHFVSLDVVYVLSQFTVDFQHSIMYRYRPQT